MEGGLALFPDAPTARGRRHVEALARAVRRGPPPGGLARRDQPPSDQTRRERKRTEAAVVFVVQRGDAYRFRPNVAADPVFARALARAARAGVRILAYRCRVTRRSIRLADPIGVELSHQ